MRKEIEELDPLLDENIKLGTIGEVGKDFIEIHFDGEKIRISLLKEEIDELVQMDNENTLFIPVNIKTKQIVW